MKEHKLANIGFLIVFIRMYIFVICIKDIEGSLVVNMFMISIIMATLQLRESTKNPVFFKVQQQQYLTIKIISGQFLQL